jgi:8-oxo-dGTP diphosphatase
VSVTRQSAALSATPAGEVDSTLASPPAHACAAESVLTTPRVRELLPVVCALIEDDAGRVLVARRAAHKHLGGQWEFPGGKIEPGELPADALVREIREELGCDVTPVRALPRCRHDYGVGAVWVELIPFVARLVPGSPPPRPLEHAELKWILPAKMGASEMVLAAADQFVAEIWIKINLKTGHG